MIDQDLDLDAIRSDVEALAAMRRSSARAGERDSAAWLARRLNEIGVTGVEIQRFHYQHSYALAHGAHNLIALAGCLRGGPLGAAFTLGALASYEQEVSGRSQWLRKLLPHGHGANVIAHLPARGRPRATLVLVAHHDAANTGVVWHPRLVAAGGRRHLRRRRVDPFMVPVELGLALGVVSGAIPCQARGVRTARAAAVALLAVALAVDADVARSATVPGASDNATGVAVSLALARALIAQPQAALEVMIVFPGCEEAGMGGMAAFLRRYGDALDQQPSLVLGLDTLGAGTPIVCAGEGAMREQRYHERDIALVEEGAAMAGERAPARWRIGGWTDPILAAHRGLRAVSLLSIGPGYFPHYHHPSDTPEHVDWRSVRRCARIAAGTIAAYARRVATEP